MSTVFLEILNITGTLPSPQGKGGVVERVRELFEIARELLEVGRLSGGDRHRVRAWV